MKLIIEDNYQELNTEVITESKGSKKYIIKGLFSTPGEKNRNGRVYPKPLWETSLMEWEKKANLDPTYRLMELEHPPRSTISKWDAVAKIRKMEFGDDGRIYGEAEILDNDANPKIGQLKALIDAGIPIGVSTRGLGRIGRGNIVEEYNLITVDIVSSPSNIGSDLAGSTEFSEGILLEKEFKQDEDGKWICDASGCSLVETETKCKETKCTDTLLDTLKEYTKEPVVLTDYEIKARTLMGLEKDKND